jgi:hypothetical protein
MPPQYTIDPNISFNRSNKADPISLNDEQKLLKQIRTQERELELRGTPRKKEKNGIVPRILDIISRPVYASANFTHSLIKDSKENAGTLDTFHNLVDNVWGGLEGKKKLTYGKVIEDDLGVRGDGLGSKLARGVGGFVADIALDPTTYLTLGTGTAARIAGKEAGEIALKGGAEIAAKTAGGQAAKQAYKSAAMQVGERVTSKMIDDFAAKGLDDTVESLTVKEGKKLSERMAQDAALEAGIKASDETLAKAGRTFGPQIKLGKTELPIPGLQSEKLYNLGQKLTNTFKATELGQGLDKTFNAARNLPGPLHAFRREVEGYSHAQFEELNKVIEQTFKGATKEDKRLIADAIEKGQSLDGIPGSKHLLTGKRVADLGVLQKEATSLLDSMTNLEVGRGILNPEDMIDNYLYHHYLSNNRKAVDKFKKARKVVQNPNKVTKATTIKTLEDAAKEGLKPVREIDDILKLRAGKSFGEQARWDFSDKVAREFGVDFGKSEAKFAEKLGLVPASSKYLKGRNIHLPEEAEEAIKFVNKLADGKEANNLLRMYDKGLAQLKFLQTAVNPGHHIRNAVGDITMNTLDGVTNPLRYAQAAKVLGDDTGKQLIKIGRGHLTTEQVRHQFKLKGAKSGMTRVEIGARKFAPAEKIRELSEAREDFTRMAHFIDALKKEGAHIKSPGSIAASKELEQAAARAAQRVRKFNIDYGDLTEVEKKLFKRVIPFYTWMRKNIPMQLEALALSPGRQALVPKTLQMMRTLVGDNGEYPTIGGLETVPNWIRDMSGVRILGEGEGRNGVYFDPARFFPSLEAIDRGIKPLEQLAQGKISDAAKTVAGDFAGDLTLPLQAGIEMATGVDTFTGNKLQDSSVGSYVQNSVPALRFLTDIADGKSSVYDKLNYLTGASLREVTPEQRTGEIRRQQDLIEGQLRDTGGASTPNATAERELSEKVEKQFVSQYLSPDQKKAFINSILEYQDPSVPKPKISTAAQRAATAEKNNMIRQKLIEFATFNDSSYASLGG